MLVLDTSVLLNVLGTGRPRLLLGYLPYKVFVPKIVIREVEREPEGATEPDARLADLIEQRLVTVLDSDKEAEAIAVTLAGAPSPDDLDDGEAFAIAHSVILNCRLAIDERKGRRIVAARWPNMFCMETLDVLNLAASVGGLSKEEYAQLIYCALRYARMPVPRNRRSEIVDLIGEERARECRSLGFV